MYDGRDVTPGLAQMKPEPPEARDARIEHAAFAVLAERGYRSASMLEIAKRAKASNQTLYALYGNKQGLFRDIILRNGAAVRQLLQETLANRDDPLHALERLGPVLLRFSTGSKAITMNRAAVNDATETGTLAQAIDELARGAIFPLMVSLMQALQVSGQFRLDHGAEDAAETYVALLFGETQFRQALGTMQPIGEEEILRRSERAFTLCRRLFATQA
jgi:AcrR family transcriptional regulator